MKKIFLLPLLLLILFSCKKPAPPALLKTSNLKSSFINMKADQPYRLKTSKGAVIKIDSGTFIVPVGKEIRLEIKEAYSARDIILAGLTTESNGRLLKSGGMIYFNATADGEALKFQKPVGITIPSTTYDKDMQLFKGEYKADSTINWVDPTPLDTSVNAALLFQGKALFDANCANCHKPSADFMGPAIAGNAIRYPSKQWIYDFVRSPADMIARKDPRSLGLWAKWKPTIMTGFPRLENAETDAIMAYAENYAKLHPENNAYQASNTSVPSADSTKSICGYDTAYTIYRNGTIVPINDGVLFDSSNQIDAKEEDTSITAYEAAYEPLPMYEFSISANGWYNVDAYSDDLTTKVSLQVQLQTGMEVDMRVYLFCPNKKIFVEANKKDNYNFILDKSDGTIPLFLNDEAIVFAFGSKDDKMYYAAGKFKIAQSQIIPIVVKETTEDQLTAFMNKNKIDGVTLDIYTNEKTVTEIPCYGSSQQPATENLK